MTCLSKCAETSQNAAADPSRIFALWRGKDLYPHVLDRQPLKLRQETVAEPLGQRAPARQHNVTIQRLAEVEVGTANGVHDDLMYAGILEANDFRVEEDFWCAEPLGANLSKIL